jgi:hypothetical protein
LDSDGKVLQIKSAQTSLTGYTGEDLIGQPFSLLYAWDEAKEQIPQKHLQLVQARGEVLVESKLARKNGQLFCASLKFKTLSNEKKEAIGYLLVIKDITYKLVYEDLHERIRSRYKHIFENQIFENQIVGIFRVSLNDFSLLRANQKALEICGIHKKEEFLISKFFWSEKERAKITLAVNNQVFLDKCHFRAKKANGMPIWASITCLVKKLEGYIEGIIVDVTESETRLQALEKANFELDTFIYHASHDLRSPLLSILGLLNILREEENPALRQKYLAAVENRVKHLDKLVQDLLAISRNERTSIEIELFDFRTEIKQILRDYYFLDEYREVEVFLDIEPDIAFYTDAFRLRIILNNLLSNAFKYRKPYGNESWVKLEIRTQNQKLLLQISDNGIGIEPKYLAKIFEMFFRASEQSKGSGLGLYIVKTMIEKLRGKIQVDSKFGQGTTFVIELPNESL